MIGSASQLLVLQFRRSDPFPPFSTLPTFNTGWSKETVTCKFSQTDLKKKKNGKTQWFLESLHREVLIFWCLKRARWNKSCLSELGQNGGLAPAWLIPHWLSCQKHPKWPPSSSDTPNITQNIPSKHPKTTLNTNDTKRHRHTSSDTLIRPTDTPRTPLKHSQTPSLHFGTAPKAWLSLTWVFWDIWISKPPYVSLPKMIEFCHFSYLLGLSERNYKLQSLWITL